MQYLFISSLVVIIISNFLPKKIYRDQLNSLIDDNQKLELKNSLEVILKIRKFYFSFLLILIFGFTLFFPEAFPYIYLLWGVGFLVILLIQNFLSTREIANLSLPDNYAKIVRRINFFAILGYLYFLTVITYATILDIMYDN